MYSIILVEDDYMERAILKKMIMSSYEFINIYEADNKDSALDIIKNNTIDIFLIDINLKNSSGLDLAVKIRNIPKYEFNQIIFLTTHIEYITQAFKQTHCYDYILKPYNRKSLLKVLNKLIVHDRDILNNDEKNKKIVVILKAGIYVDITIKDIIFIEVKGKNCEIHTTHGTYTSGNISLRKLMKLINSKNIIQSHRAFCVNKDYISKIERVDVKLSNIYFKGCNDTALLGYKFKNDVISKFKEGKVIIC